MENEESSITVTAITQMLEEEIMLGIKQSGHRLVEEELCQRFNVRRYMIRQSLIELEKAGLVEKKRNIGAIVRYYSVDEVLDLYAVREILEEACLARIKLPLSTKQVEHLKQIQALHDKAVSESNLRKAVRQNLIFHRAIYDLCENPVLVSAVLEYGQRAQAIRSLTYASPSQLEQKRDEHWEFINALSKGNRAELLIVAAKHIRTAKDNYISIHRSYNDI